jgi:lysophospholipid acyltransferase (LPLAT)-like uncharacterized protein
VGTLPEQAPPRPGSPASRRARKAALIFVETPSFGGGAGATRPYALANHRYNNCVPVLSQPTASGIDSPGEPGFGFRQKLALSLITWMGVFLIRLLGPTLRFAVSYEPGSPAGLEAHPVIYSFWHNCMIPATYLWRNLHIYVLSSDSFDGEYTGRIIRKFGFLKIRGSASRGAVRGILGMRRELQQGSTVAFTIDGPRGPRYVVKPGPVLLARATGVPMASFHIALENAWILNTWDRLMIPKPFSRALMRVSRQIFVRAGADDREREQLQADLQAALDRVRQFAEAHVAEVGSREFPLFKRTATER